VWKAALRIFNTSYFNCKLLDLDWGCGIIDTSQMSEPISIELPEKLNYNMHFPYLLKYKYNVPSYLREKLKVFYHLACMGNWADVFKEQIEHLRAHGFQNINFTILGNENDILIVKELLNTLKINHEILFTDPNFNHFEKPALLAIEKYAKENNGHVLYIHSKGVSDPANNAKTKWRRLMMRELVENWESCLFQLLNIDGIGVNWRDFNCTSHFCGNFWYASTEYLRKLEDFNHYYDNPRYRITDTINDKRLGCEFWIGSGKEKPRLLSLVCRNVDFCNEKYWLRKDIRLDVSI
jgi:hypothetical protein